MPRVKIKLADNITRVVFVETDATVGATIGTDLKLPNGQVGTVAQLQALLGISTGEPEPTDHRLLLGLTVGDDHPQYTRKDTLTTRGDLYARGSTTVQRLALGADRQFFRAGALDPAWETVSPTVTLGTDLSGNVTLTNLASGTLGATIVANAVTDAKLRDSGGLSVIGRSANSSGDPADIAGTADQVLRVNSAGTALGFGTVATAGLTDDSVTDAKIRNGAGLSVIGRSASTTGDPADIAGTADQVLRVNTAGTVLGFGTIATGGLAANAVTNAKLAQMVQATIKGRADAAGTGDPTDLTAAQVAAIVNSSLDHGTLTGLGDDDHTQYVLRNILTANGDIFTRTAGAIARLGIGTSLQLLRTVAGAPSWQTLSPVLTLGTDLSGNATLTDLGSATLNATIVNDAVTDAKLRNSSALSVIGRSASTSGDPADIVGTADQILRVNSAGTTLGFGTLATGGLADAAVTNAKLADMAAATIKGRASGSGTGVPVDLTATQVATIISGETISWTGENSWTQAQYASLTSAQVAGVSGLAQASTAAYLDTRLSVSRVANPPTFRGVRLNTSYAAPSAMLTNDMLCQFTAGGYDGTTMRNGTGSFSYRATEDWTSTKRGTSFEIGVARTGTAVLVTIITGVSNATGDYVGGPDGVAAQPGWTFTSDIDTGMYRITTNTLGFATGGTERLRFDTSGGWGLAGANFGTAGQALVSNGSGAAPTWQNVSTFLGSSNTSIPAGNTIANTASETAFTSSYTIPANTLRAGSVIRIKLFGTYGTDAVLAPTLQGRLKIGGTTRLDTGSLTAVVGATNRGWTAEGQIVVQSIGASGVADAQGTAQFSTAVTAALSVHMPNTATFTLDTTATQAITVTIQWGTADTDNTITLRQFVVSISNP